VLLRALWFGVIPALASGVTVRYLLPPDDVRLGAFVRAVREHPLWLGLALFVLYSALVRYWRGALPGGTFLGASRSGEFGARDALTTALTAVVAAGAALLLRAFVVEPFAVHGVSMLPTLEPGDYLVADKLVSGARPKGLARGDVVVLRRPGAEDVVKRVIGLPGDRVRVSSLVNINGWLVPSCDAGHYFRVTEGKVVDGRLLVEFLEDDVYLTLALTGDHWPELSDVTVGPGELFVLGDDRGLSVDSREWNRGKAPVRITDVVGRVDRVLARSSVAELAAGERFFRRLGLDVRANDIDVRELEAGIQGCLAKRPPLTRPPAPSATAPGRETAEATR